MRLPSEKWPAVGRVAQNSIEYVILGTMKFTTVAARMVLFVFLGTFTASAQVSEKQSDFWAARDVVVEQKPNAKKVRIGIWDSGVDISLFEGRIALGADKKVLVRGYDPFKLRKDTVMAVLPKELLPRQDELNGVLRAFEDLDGNIDSPIAREYDQREKKMTKAERDEVEKAVRRWDEYTHGKWSPTSQSPEIAWLES